MVLDELSLDTIYEAIARADREQATRLAAAFDKLLDNHSKQLELCDEMKRAINMRLADLKRLRSELTHKHGV